jgi:hypothetical protein
MRNQLGKGPGRPKGAANKITKDIRQAISEAFEKAGGVDYLVKLSVANPNAFAGLLAKVIPQEIKAVIENNHYVIETPAHTDTTDVWQQQHAPKSIM